MCVAIHQLPGNRISEEILRLCAEKNPDGMGFAYRESETGILKRYTRLSKVNKLIKRYHYLREKNEDSPFILHFRRASAGTVSIENCHPFIVHNRIAIAHNGTLREYKVDKEERSDTSIFSEEMIANLPPNFLEYEGLIHMLEEVVGYSKIVFFDAVNREVVILNETAGRRDSSGNWFSNFDWQSTAVEPWWVRAAQLRAEGNREQLSLPPGQGSRLGWDDSEDDGPRLVELVGGGPRCEVCGKSAGVVIQYAPSALNAGNLLRCCNLCYNLPLEKRIPLRWKCLDCGDTLVLRQGIQYCTRCDFKELARAVERQPDIVDAIVADQIDALAAKDYEAYSNQLLTLCPDCGIAAEDTLKQDQVGCLNCGVVYRRACVVCGSGIEDMSEFEAWNYTFDGLLCLGCKGEDEDSEIVQNIQRYAKKMRYRKADKDKEYA